MRSKIWRGIIEMARNNAPDDLSDLPVNPAPDQLLDLYKKCREKLVSANRSRSPKGSR